MFQKKDYIFSESMGVCVVADIVKLSAEKGNTIFYYVLRSVKNKEKVSYIPVEHHRVVLRNLIEPDVARQKLKQKDKISNREIEEAEFVLEMVGKNSGDRKKDK